MNFKDWFRGFLLEMGDVSMMDTSRITLIPLGGEEFDEEEAQQECEQNLSYDFNFDSSVDVYDDPEDDPDFDATKPEDWEDRNPEPQEESYIYYVPNAPDRDKFADQESFMQAKQEWLKIRNFFAIAQEPEEANFPDQESFVAAKEAWSEAKREYEDEHEEWENERDEIYSNYESEKEDWQERMDRKRNIQDEERNEALSDAIWHCVKEKEKEHNEENNKKGFKTKFSVNTENGIQDFEVEMFSEEDNNYEGVEIPDSYTIEFSGPNNHATTGKAGTTAPKIYSYLLLSIKKLLETQPVNAIAFGPAEPAMGLVYQRFYNQFLAKDFIEAQRFFYIKKSFVKEKMQGLNREDKIYLAKKMKDKQKEAREKEAEVRQQKNEERTFKLNFPKLLHQFVYINNQPAYVYSIRHEKLISSIIYYIHPNEYGVVADRNYAVEIDDNITNFLKGRGQLQQPNSLQIKWLLQQISVSPVLKDYDIGGIDKWYQQYGITPKEQI